MDVGKSFAFVFEDKDWIVKILIGAAILLLGILFSWLLLVPLILALALLGGYGVEITRRIIRGNPLVLPEWEDWGALIVDGLKVIAIGIVYALPAILVSVCLGIPIGVLSEGSDAAAALSGLFSAALTLFNLAWAIVMSLVFPAALASYADSGDLGAAFRFGNVLALVRNNFGTYLITLLMSWVALMIGKLGVILICGWLFTMPYYYMVMGHLYGQAYLAAKGQPTPEPAPTAP